jgi:hypothetical protein
LLFLGSSESVEEGSQLFQVVDKKHRIYVQQPASRAGLPMPIRPSTYLPTLEVQERPLGGLGLPGRSFDQASSTTAELPKGLEHLSERIFDAFTQASETVCSEFGGLGLGLAIAKAIVEGHGGIIRGYSAGPNQGAIFTVELKAARL